MLSVTDSVWTHDGLMADCPAVLLAGGRGTRLHSLTDRECKPALRFGNRARIVDFALANACYSGVRQILAATQYRPSTLHRHLIDCWQPVFAAEGGHIQLCYGPHVTGTAAGYAGTAAAVADNIARLDALAPEHVLILAADHIYRMDYRAMFATHLTHGADLTVAAAAVPVETASDFGIIGADSAGRIRQFLEKPVHPPAMPDDPGKAFVSMGIYIFRWAVLREALLADQAQPLSSHDFGHDILGRFVRAGQAAVHELSAVAPGVAPGWRDVGTLDAFRAAHLDLLRDTREQQELERIWPLLPWRSGQGRAVGQRPLACENASAFIADSCLIGQEVRVARSVIMPGAVVGRGCRLSDCIIAPGVVLPPGMVVGIDAQADSQRFLRTAEGTVLVTPDMLRSIGHSQTGVPAVRATRISRGNADVTPAPERLHAWKGSPDRPGAVALRAGKNAS